MTRPSRLRFLERRITRDAKVPISADDLEMENGWRCIPIRRPTMIAGSSSTARATTKPCGAAGMTRRAEDEDRRCARPLRPVRVRRVHPRRGAEAWLSDIILVAPCRVPSDIIRQLEHALYEFRNEVVDVIRCQNAGGA